MARMLSGLKWTVKQQVKRLFRISDEYRFVPSRSIRSQRMEVMVNGAPLVVETDHATPLYETVAEIVDYDCYQLAKIDFAGSPSAAVVDIGANVGISALVFSRYHAGRIICYEPMERNCEFLRRNAELNRIDTIEIVQKAVTKTNGEVTFRVERDVSVSGRLMTDASPAASPSFEQVRVRSVDLRGVFDGLGGGSIGLMKLDCEGGEYDIIDQIEPAMLEKIHAITMEVHDLDDRRNLRRLMGQFEQMNLKVSLKEEMFGRSNLHHILAVR